MSDETKTCWLCGAALDQHGTCVNYLASINQPAPSPTAEVRPDETCFRCAGRKGGCVGHYSPPVDVANVKLDIGRGEAQRLPPAPALARALEHERKRYTPEAFSALVERVGPLPTTGLASAEAAPARDEACPVTSRPARCCAHCTGRTHGDECGPECGREPARDEVEAAGPPEKGMCECCTDAWARLCYTCNHREVEEAREEGWKNRDQLPTSTREVLAWNRGHAAGVAETQRVTLTPADVEAAYRRGLAQGRTERDEEVARATSRAAEIERAYWEFAKAHDGRLDELSRARAERATCQNQRDAIEQRALMWMQLAKKRETELDTCLEERQEFEARGFDLLRENERLRARIDGEG